MYKIQWNQKNLKILMRIRLQALYILLNAYVFEILCSKHLW